MNSLTSYLFSNKVLHTQLGVIATYLFPSVWVQFFPVLSAEKTPSVIFDVVIVIAYQLVEIIYDLLKENF